MSNFHEHISFLRMLGHELYQVVDPAHPQYARIGRLKKDCPRQTPTDHLWLGIGPRRYLFHRDQVRRYE
jgi:hypothetical protein